jgi:hypothetical protein
MDTQRHDRQQPARKTEAGGKDAQQERREADARERAETAARAVMHPESYDREWRFYHGAWGG